ncbi:hypothetical protein F4779DRAFT_615369 [Xylariaceae sp. FL0662B]|nr:hypothetical protein F4779DRAFT_615369 [Xylariaceae sp. FL0662B]
MYLPIYRTKVPLCPAGVFTRSTYAVLTRPYKVADVEKVREITRGRHTTHGRPIAWGWDALQKLGIRDIDAPEWSGLPLMDGCVVTPQEAVAKAGIEGTVMGRGT